jgi:nicotinate-nucleotide pyrophosphorylase (carboxylating)
MTEIDIAPLHSVQYEPILRRELAEDLGRGGDLTTDAVVPAGLRARAAVVARQPGRVAGVDVAASTFRLLDPEAEVAIAVADGRDVGAGQSLLEIVASARAVLSAERTALNLLARMCGVATLTRTYVAAVEGTRARVVCTRKTTPGLRTLEKYAVRCGGGANHRFGLDDAVLVKDNHLAVAGGVAAAVERIRGTVGHTVTVEVEVDTLDQLREALDVGVNAVLLDNMSLDELRRAVDLVDGCVITEASGGISLDTAAAVAATGVDLLSVGALTHSAPALDVSLDVLMG